MTAWSSFLNLSKVLWSKECAKWSYLSLLSVTFVMLSYQAFMSQQRPKARKYQDKIEELTDRFGKTTVIINAFPASLDFSPYLIKFETFLRINRIRYVKRQSQKFGQTTLPENFWIIAFEGQIYDDINEAIKDLSIKHDIDMDLHLNEGQKAIGRTFEKMLEHHLYHLILIQRWTYDQGQHFKRTFFPQALQKGWCSNWLLYKTVSAVSSRMEAMSYFHGLVATGQQQPQHIGRDKVMQSIREDLQCVEDFLQNKTFFMGTRVSRTDCTVFAFLRLIFLSPASPEVGPDFRNKFPRCQNYVKRMLSLYFPVGGHGQQPEAKYCIGDGLDKSSCHG